MRSMQQMKDSIAQMAADAFKDHTAKIIRIDDQTQILVWRAPETSMYSAEYLIRRNILTVTGDMGCAIYMWSAPITFEGLASYSLDYFAEKIQASPSGRYGKEWIPEAAEDRLHEWVEDGKNEPSDDLDHMDDYERRKRIVYGTGSYGVDDAMGSIGSQEDWSRWLEHNGPSAFGMDWWEWGSIGVGTNSQTRYHWHGITAAVKWLKDHS